MESGRRARDGRKEGWGIHWFVVEGRRWGRTLLVGLRMERVVGVVSKFSDYSRWMGA